MGDLQTWPLVCRGRPSRFIQLSSFTWGEEVLHDGKPGWGKAELGGDAGVNLELRE